MPNRWLKEAYCTSPRIEAVSADARDLWVRLLVNADDHGYFHGSAQIVASRCFPLQPNARKCEQLLAELVSALLIVRYESGGKQYLVITQWYERARAKPKYPEPPESCKQLLADANNGEQVQAIARLHDHVLSTTSTSTTNAPSDVSLDADRGWVGITDADMKLWAAAYPAVTLQTELAKARAWAVANPKNRKENWRRFLTNWLARTQEKAPAAGGGPSGSKKVAL